MKYREMKQTLFNEHIGTYQTYGIIAENTDSKVEDVSVNKNFVEYIVSLFNSNDVALVHMGDIIDDML